MLQRHPATSAPPLPPAPMLTILLLMLLAAGLASESPSREQMPSAVMPAEGEAAAAPEGVGAPAEKRGWADMQHGWGKRGWADLRSAWGKRGWRDLQGGWGKRDWNSFRGAWGKRGTGSPWNNFRGSWGKRGYGPSVYDDGEEAGWGGGDEGGPDEEGDVYGRQLEAAEAAAAAAGYLPHPDDYLEDKRSWGNLKGAWGKRAEEEDVDDGDNTYGKRAWKNLKGSWGKRDPGWHNLKGLWGKRAPVAAKWNKLTSVWGKRSFGGEPGVKPMDTSLPSGV